MRQRPTLTSLIAFCLIATPIVYVMGYAPYLRIRYGPPPEYNPATMSWSIDWDYEIVNRNRFYAPIEWLIDNTSAKTPILLWASLWDAEMKATRDSASRLREREQVEWIWAEQE